MADNECCDGAPPHALAVFHDRGGGFWPRVFGRPGFRHCFVAVNDGRAWIVIDPCSDGTRISADVAAAVDLAAHYRGLGCTVVETAVAQSRRRYGLPWAFTCVEAVKRILHVHGWWLWTPYQLYRCLESRNGIISQSATPGADLRTEAAQRQGGGK
ncbi:hypothetical protein AAFN88_12745 [Pelagibius sp. CAU 1746]|uniref:hypothetical protein n=1 Tax=Pelagibius sp. CAU 1746 TaxID=3140370 RepID=UPI00325C2648